MSEAIPVVFLIYFFGAVGMFFGQLVASETHYDYDPTVEQFVGRIVAWPYVVGKFLLRAIWSVK